MDAWPMIARCMLAQWRGYPLELREGLDACWNTGVEPQGLGGHYVGYCLYPIWTVVGSTSHWHLLAIKETQDDPTG